MVANTTIVAAITAMPPPCGVGVLCDERALGLATAKRLSTGLSQSERTKLIAPAARSTIPANSISQAKASPLCLIEPLGRRPDLQSARFFTSKRRTTRVVGANFAVRGYDTHEVIANYARISKSIKHDAVLYLITDNDLLENMERFRI
jgi:hypothetical protein